MSTEEEMIVAVLEHAQTHYDTKWGWDIVVETMEYEEIAEIFEGARTLAGAIKKVGAYIWPIAQHRAEIQSTAW